MPSPSSSSEWPATLDAGYRYHDPDLDLTPRMFWTNRVLRASMTVVFLLSAWLAHGLPALERVVVDILTLSDARPGLYIAIVIASFGMYPIHEAIHGLAGRALGFSVRFGIDWYGPVPFVVTYGRPQTRAETAFIAAAPLVSVTLVLFPLIVVGTPYFAAVTLLPLVVNTLGAAGDLNTVWEMSQLPPGALVEHDRDENAQYYVPADD